MILSETNWKALKHLLNRVDDAVAYVAKLTEVWFCRGNGGIGGNATNTNHLGERHYREHSETTRNSIFANADSCGLPVLEKADEIRIDWEKDEASVKARADTIRIGNAETISHGIHLGI